MSTNCYSKTNYFQDPEQSERLTHDVYSAYRTKQRPLKPHCGARRRSDRSGIGPGTARGCGSSLHCRECLVRSFLCTQVKLASAYSIVLQTGSGGGTKMRAVFCSSDDELRMLSCNDILQRCTRHRGEETLKQGAHCQPAGCRAYSSNPPPPKLKL